MSDWSELIPQLLPGLWVTLQLTVAALAIGFPLGVCLAVGSSTRGLRWPVIALVEIGRGAPGLILLYVVYYGLPQLHVTLSSFPSAVLAIGLTTAAYSCEVFRAGIRAVGHGQREASQALGLNAFNEFRLVVLPQAIKIVVPPLIGMTIIVYQGTSLAYAVSVPELLSRAYNIGTITFEFLSPLSLAGAMYAVISLLGVALLRARWPGRWARRAADATTTSGSLTMPTPL